MVRVMRNKILSFLMPLLLVLEPVVYIAHPIVKSQR